MRNRSGKLRVEQSPTLVDVLRARAHTQPERRAYTFLGDGEAERDHLRYGELEARTRAVAARLQEHGVRGEPVLLLFPPGLDFVLAFLGCLAAGAVAVPAYPPRRNRIQARLRAIAGDARARVVLTCSEIPARLRDLGTQAPELAAATWLAIDETDAAPEDWRGPDPEPDELAFLQYTSGSTSSPKGVMVSHGNLMHNQQLIRQACDHCPESVFVSWLPLYHDLGLIGNLLQALYVGAPCVLMSPLAFLQKPLRWLEAISHYRATTSGGPNFAYELCLRKIPAADRRGLDLSSWEVAFNGAEPVRAETLERFAQEFRPCGFNRRAAYPCYGLAEATLMVSGPRPASPTVARFDPQALEEHRVVPCPKGRKLVGCGAVLGDQEVRIVDPSSSTPLPPARVGEIWVAGASIAKGYWNRPQESAETFGGCLGGDDEKRFLRTGDLGFLASGELFVSGRLKDLIIIRGRNHYPQDLERTVEKSHPALRPDGGAAFSLDADGEERLVVVNEVERRAALDGEEVAGALRRAVAEEHELHAWRVVLIRTGTLPKTTSGKVQRRACREALLAGRLKVVADSVLEEVLTEDAAVAPSRELLAALGSEERRPLLESYLSARLARVLRLPAGRLDPAVAPATLGLDSLAAITLSAELESAFGVSLPLARLLEGASLGEIVAEIGEIVAEIDAAVVEEPTPASGEAFPGDALSYGQRALWLLQRLAPASAALNVVGAALARDAAGELDRAALRRAFQALVDRHPALRTNVDAGQSDPQPRIHPHRRVAFTEVDVAALSPPARAEQLAAAAYHPFDLERDSLLRVYLFRDAPGEWVILLAVHHIVSDFWSLAILARELEVLYRQQKGEVAVALAPVTGDEELRRREEALAGARGEELWAYWRRQLDGLPQLDLLTDRPRPPRRSFRGAAVSRRFGPRLGGRLRALAEERGATLYMTLLAAFQLLLHRYCGQDDLVVGSPTAGRGRAALAGRVGYFVNPVVLRADLGGEPGFTTFLERVRRTVLDAFAHAELPFALLAERLQPKRDPSRAPIVQVMFALQKAQGEGTEALSAFALRQGGVRVDLGALVLETVALEERTSQFDLTLFAGEVDDELAVSLQYDPALFDAVTMRRLLGHFRTLLAGIVEGPEANLAELALLTPAERQQLVREWNDSAAKLRQEPLHRLFEDWAERTPDALALIFEDQQWSFAELNAGANQLARHLRRLGVGAETPVALGLGRSPEMVVGVLATLKAGGAYLPLDPDYPRDRLAFMLEDSAAPVLLTRTADEVRFAAGSSLTIVRLDADRPAIAQEAAANLPVIVSVDQPAYVIYTSGSTGFPKGVACRHRGPGNLLASFERLAPLAPGERSSLWTSLSFDVSVYEIFSPLCYGRPLALPTESVRSDAAAFFGWLAALRIGGAYVPPHLLADFADWLDAEAPALALRRLLVGVEPIPETLLARIAGRIPGLAIVNGYGPTEASVCAALFPVDPARATERTTPIGRAPCNYRTVVLDRRLQPVPVATAGEVLIGGAGLARGYLRRPALTAERFIPSPLADDGPGTRLYRTGDLARWLADGVLQFLGRIDHQVKVRGFRIELGEVESALRRHPGVREAVVRAQDAAGGKRLVAFAVPERIPGPDPGRQRLVRWPNGLQVAHQGEIEAEHFYEDIFEKRIYRRHGIELDDGAAIFDVGANIGTFTLFAHRECRDPQIYAFEPAPPLFEKLRLNTALHGVAARLFPIGLSDRSATASFTFYPASSGMSSFHADPGEEREVLRTMMEHQLASGVEGMAELMEHADDLLEERFRGETFECRLRTLSEVIDECGVEWIDLLKIDVQKCELEVLEGIREEHWSGIRQLVVEVHDFAGRLERITRMLEGRGFRVTVEQDELVAGTVLWNLYAVRGAAPGDGVRERQRRAFFRATAEWKDPALSGELRDLLRAQLPETMMPSALVLLKALPLTPSAKLDRPALDGWDLPEPAAADGFVAPRGAVEEVVAGICAQVLDRDRVGVDDDFFDLGGHSLLAGRVIARVRDAFRVELALRTLFEAPTVAGLAREVEAARRAQQGLKLPPPEPVPRDPETPIPLSFAQRRLWFLDQLEPGSSSYHIPAAVRLAGPLDRVVLERTLSEIVRRHEALRTVFGTSGGRPVEIITPAVPVAVRRIDLAELPAAEREPRARQLAAVEARKPFDLARGLLFRFALLRLEAGDHLLVVTLHHIVADGWSMAVLLRELRQLYAAFAAGESSPLSELPVQYAEYAHWQRRWLGDEALAPQLAYWRRRLAGAATVVELPTDRPRPAVQRFRGAGVPVIPSAALRERLAALGRSRGATPFMTLLAAFATLLHRYSGQDDVLVGSPIAGRNQVAFEGMIGLFVNTLVLRTELSGTPDQPVPSFAEVLARVRLAALQAYTHQDLPFERLVEELGIPRDLSRMPLFQVAFALQPAKLESVELGAALTSEPWPFDAGMVRFDLELHLWDGSDGLSGFLAYNTDLWDATSIRRMAAHLETLLAAVVREPAAPIDELPLLSGSERHQLLEWSETIVPATPAPTVHERFADWAADAPDAVAVVFREATLSYGELNRRTNQLAHHLRALGVGPEIRVGICVDRSPEMVVGVLGILKAGGAYVPLDPSYPQQRLAFMVEDGRLPVVVTRERRIGSLPAFAGGLVDLDRGRDEIAGRSGEDPRSGVSAENLAYVIYTSGSTGRPKGVQVTHRGLGNLSRAQILSFAEPPAGRVLQFASLSFDASIFEISMAFSAGATLHLESAEALLPGAALSDQLRRLAITNATLPPSALAVLPGGELPGLKTLVVAGEACSTELVDRWADGRRFFNAYGPTEATVWSTVERCLAGRGRPAIGRPIANTRAHLPQPLPFGVPGELHVGGVGLARGYLNRPQLTAEKFIPDPWSAQPGARLYKTGDLVRTLADGGLDFLGRIDHQVKVRGFRIELGEVAAVLGEHPEVREAVAVVGEGERLVGYFVPAEGCEPGADALRGFMQQRLPGYMVPAVLVRLEALPLTPSGKVDRRALPAPEHFVPEGGAEAPRTPAEQALAGIWSEVLGLEGIGVHNDFFELGGHSLLATQVISRVRESLQVDLPLRALFDAPTVAGLAARVEAARRAAVEAIPRSSRDQPPPLSFAQERMWFLDRLDPGHPVYNIPCAVQLAGELRIPALAAGLDAVVDRHEILRTTFTTAAGRPVQVIAPVRGGLPALPVIDLRDLPAATRRAEVGRLVLREARRSFDLARGPLLRAAVLALAEADHVLLLSLHHIVADGWSMDVLLRDLAAFYEAARSGRPARRRPLPIQYADFTRWQREWLAGEVLAGQLDYWRRQLAGGVPAPELPADRPRPPLLSFRGATRFATLPADLVEALRALGRERGATLFTTLLAAFQALLYRYTGQRDLAVASLVANRNRLELEELIGVFVNTLVLRCELGDEPAFSTVLGRVREVVLGAQAHQDLPFEKLVEELEPDRDLSHNPLAQVMLVLQNAPLDLTLPDLTLRPLPVDNRTAKFDLLISLHEPPRGAGLEGRLEYSTDLYDATTIARLEGHYRQLLASIAADPERRLDELSLLSAAERHQQLAEWGRGPAARPRPETIHDLFRAQVERSPEAVALVAGEAQLSYRELERRSARLARRLAGLGVGADVLVAICMERSVENVVAILGTLMAGGAYVPLDPDYPRERLALMLEDARAPVLLTQEGLRERLPEHRAEVIVLEPVLRVARANDGLRPGEPPQALVLATLREGFPADHLAYVIYTSGSTGRPKGVAIAHRSVAVLLRWAREAFTARELRGVLASTSLCFDLSVFELFVPLSWGGTVILAANALELPSLAGAARITLVNTVPSAMEELVRGAGPPPGVVTVNLAGEPFKRRLARQLYAGRVERVFNLYGPSEDTTYSTWARIAGHGPGMPAAGRPVAGTRVDLLDAHGRPVAVGIAGEVCLGGAGLVRGYLNRPALTAERFVPDPFAEAPGRRLYRTGDLARWLGDGNLDFLGRIDHQVKVRGFRIELGEIETALAAQATVAEAVVTAREHGAAKRLVAYVVRSREAADEPGDWTAELRRALRRRLPEYLVPSVFVALDALPRTPNGKVDRRALPAPERGRLELEAAYVEPRSGLEEAVAAIWREVLALDRIGIHDNFFDAGGHSLALARVQSLLHETVGCEVSMVDLFRYPTVGALAGHLAAAGVDEPAPRRDRVAVRRQRLLSEDSQIAVVGLAGRFPGARHLGEFWRNLRDGVESISFFDREELLSSGVDPAVLADPRYVPARAVLEDVDLFDAEFFGFNPEEAASLDPQHRLFLETAWEAVEDAGYDVSGDGSRDEAGDVGAVGVYAGVAINTYWLNHLRPADASTFSADLFRQMIGNDGSFLPTLVSYKLGLRGPSLDVRTACSTSLVAVHLAAGSLLAGECDMALAGGVAVSVPQRVGYLWEEDSFLSPDGHCRPFDAEARGTVSGSGVGVVVLKRLADAEAAGDSIRAVIKGSAINNDGNRKVGYTAPGVDGQAEVIAQALGIAGVDPATVGYVETHGTGTRLGDPIEIAALRQAFGDPATRCAIGSVKSNIGHLDTAAGIAGLIKAVLMLEHRSLPPSLHFAAPNPKIDFGAGSFYVPTELGEWSREDVPRRAGVSSFGIGGTNAHLVLEEAPPRPPAAASRRAQLLVLSAKSEPALASAARRLGEYLDRHPEIDLADAAYTLQVGRRAFDHRLIQVCRDRDEAAAALGSDDPQRLLRARAASRERPVAFLFPGLGDQYVGMGAGLYRDEPTFRRELDRCAELLAPHLELDLRQLLYPAADSEAAAGGELDLRRMLGRGEASGDDQRLNRTAITQPAVFAIEYALARLWMEWGVRPRALLGYSVGEYTAACVAGVLTLEDALALVARRARLIEEIPQGAMLAVPLPEAEVGALLGEGMSLAAVNGPELSVVAGPEAAVAALEERLAGDDVITSRLNTAHGFHSQMLEPIFERVVELVSGVALRPPRIPWISNLSGRWITAGEATDPRYWARHMCAPVRFADGVGALWRKDDFILLEVGPGQSLSSLARQHPACAENAERAILASMRHAWDPQDDQALILTALGRLWIEGAGVDWQGFSTHEERRRVPLPTYPFERRRFWIDRAAEPAGVPEPAPRPEASPAQEHPTGDDASLRLYLPTWRRSPRPAAKPPADGGCWLIFTDEHGLGSELARRLEQEDREVFTVAAGDGFARLDRRCTIDPWRDADYRTLLDDLHRQGKAPRTVVHLWNVADDEGPADRVRDLGFSSLLSLARALAPAEGERAEPVEVLVLSTRAQRITGDEPAAVRAMVLAPCRVMAQEYPHLSCRSIDFPLPPAEGRRWGRRVEQLLAEITASSAEAAVAYRGNDRWAESFELLEPSSEEDGDPPAELSRGGVWLIVDGLEGRGFELARYLTAAAEAPLALVEPESLAPREAWPDWLASHGEGDGVGRRIRRILALEELGAQPLVLAVDPADPRQLAAAARRAEAELGPLHGVYCCCGGAATNVFAPLAEIDDEAWKSHLQSVAARLAALEETLDRREPRFCLLESSLAATLGGVGLVGHTAASLLINALVADHNQRHPVPWLSVGWDRWQEAEPEAPASAGATAVPSIAPHELARAWGRLLELREESSILLSAGDLRPRLEQARTPAAAVAEATPGARHGRPALRNPYVAPEGDLESRLAEILSEVLGIEPIGVHDSFFELGGHSLLGARLITRLRQSFGVELRLRHLFEAPTVAGLALVIEGLIIAELEQLPVE